MHRIPILAILTTLAAAAAILGARMKEPYGKEKAGD